MAWYAQNTVTVTNGNATVTGSGTGFITNVSIGEGFIGPDGRTYEITNVVSDTSFTIKPNYQGATASGQSYLILPARGRIADLIAETQSLLSSFATVRDGIGAGLLPDGSTAAPALRFSSDQDTGIRRLGPNILSIVTGATDRMIFTDNGDVGVAWGTPNAKLGVLAQGENLLRLLNASGSGVNIEAIDQNWSGRIRMADGNWRFRAGVTEVMSMLNNGNVGIGTTSPSSRLSVAVPGGVTALSITGDFAGGNTVTINPYVAGVSNDGFEIRIGSNRRLSIDASGHVLPGGDGTQNLGSGSLRFNNSYFAVSPTVTSDETQKQWRGPLNAAELRAAKRIIGELGIYQWNDAVAEKGEDGARLHFGVRAQRAFAILDDEGLDWGRYAWACYDEWDEQTEPVMEEVTVTKTRKVSRPSTLIDPATGQPAMVEVDEAYEETEMQPTGETRVTLEAGDRYGVRPDQLAFWLIAAQAAVQADLEARIAALEAAA